MRNKRIKTAVLTSILLLALVPTMAVAQPVSQAADPMSAEGWLARMDESLGGRSALDALTSLAVAASCQGPDGPFETRVDSFRPGWVHFWQARGEEPPVEVWSAPERTWGLGPEGEPRDFPAGVRYFVRAHEFHFLLFDLRDRFSDFRVAEPATVRGKDCASLAMKDESGRDAALFLSRETGLPVMLEMNPEGAEGAVRIYFEDWRENAEVLFFHAFDLTEGADREFRYDYQSIEPDSVSALSFVEPSTGQPSDRAALLDILHDDRRAHLETDVERLLGHMAEELVEVSAGQVQRRTREDMRELFEEVFAGATYDRWDDLEPPHLKLSRDGSLAWVTRRVEVRRSSSGTPDGGQISFVSAYSSTYEKLDERWQMTSVTSTFAGASAG